MNENILKQERVKFHVEKEGILIKAAVLFMAASAVLRLIGCWGLWDDPFFTTTQIVLPICCNILFVLCLMFLGKKFFALSSIPVILGAVFFIIRATDFVWWKMLLGIIAYLATAFLYAATAFGIVRSKWPLTAVFGLPLLIHLGYDFTRLGDKVNPVTLSDGLQEISVICILLSLLFTAFAMKKPKAELEKAGLPKIKGPKFIKIGKNKAEAESEPEQNMEQTEEQVKEKTEDNTPENTDITAEEKDTDTKAGE